MSQADALLLALEDVAVPHRHSVSDSDTHFVIDPDSRMITNAAQSPIRLMQGDHNSEVFTFEIPKYVEGHDMTQCNRVRLHFINIGSSNRQTYRDVAELALNVSPDDPVTLVSSWEIRRQATQYAGSLSFLIHFMCVDSDGNITYEWHTDIYSDVEIGATFDNGEPIVFEYSNILEDWYQRIFGAGNSVAEDAIARIEAKAIEALNSIPEDYTAVANMAEEALRKKANAIILESEGENIFVDDASDSPLLGLRVFGKTTQAADPTPDNPQELVSLENITGHIFGKNLLKTAGVTQTVNGITITVCEDGSFTATGTSTAAVFFGVNFNIRELTPGVSYALTGCPAGGSSSTYRLYAQTSDGKKFAGDVGSGTRFTATDEQWQVLFVIYSGNTVDLTVYPMLRLASVEDASWEPYVPRQELQMPYHFAGIPVESGGNYTDANGQQWICDEIDFARGVYVKRIGATSFADATWAQNSSGKYFSNKDRGVYSNEHSVLCTHVLGGEASDGNLANVIFINANRDIRLNIALDDPSVAGVAAAMANANMIGVLAEPIETPLTDPEIANFKMVCTNYHNTTVLNDAGAHMAIKYNADTLIFLRDHQPDINDERIWAAVDAWLTQHFANAEGVSF